MSVEQEDGVYYGGCGESFVRHSRPVASCAEPIHFQAYALLTLESGALFGRLLICDGS